LPPFAAAVPNRRQFCPSPSPLPRTQAAAPPCRRYPLSATTSQPKQQLCLYCSRKEEKCRAREEQQEAKLKKKKNRRENKERAGRRSREEEKNKKRKRE
jgi:hypothetical protein